MDADALLGLADADGANLARRKALSFTRRCAGAQGGRPRRDVRNVRALAAAAQTRHHNLEYAGKKDWEFHDARPKLSGSGAWKKRTVQESLRVSFDHPPAMNVTHIAQTMRPKAGHGCVVQIMAATAYLLRQGQTAAIEEAISSARFAVFQPIFDESEYRYMLSADKCRRGLEHKTLACCGRLLWADANFAEHEDEMILEPRSMESNRAACLSSTLRNQIPKCLFDMWSGGPTPDAMDIFGVVPGSDSHPANVMFNAHLSNSAARNVIVHPGYCKQHSTANAIVPITRKLKILNPTFCIVKRRRNAKFDGRFLDGLRKGLAAKLEHIRGSERPDWRPDPSHAQNASLIVDLTLFDCSLGDVNLDEDARGAMHRRREVTNELIRRCAGDWRTGSIIFWDPDNEFPSKEAAVDHVYKLLTSTGFQAHGTPAGNKWMSLFPTACKMLFEMSFHKVFLYAMRYACKQNEEEADNELSELSDGELIGALSSHGWKTRERRRELKALVFSRI